MSLLHDGAFLAHLSQSKVEAKQQVNRMIDAIYAKVMLDLELWLNKHETNEDNDSSVQQLEVNPNAASGEPIELILPNTQFQMQQNVNSPHSQSPSHFQSHSNDFTVKSEIESDCEENVTEHSLPGESPDWQPTPLEPLQPTHSITPHTSYPSIVKEEIVDDDAKNEVDNVDSRVIQNEHSNDFGYFPANNGISEFDGHEVSNRLPLNVLTQQSEYNQEQMHFDDDLEIDQETLDEVKREIEEEENMKRRENELEAGEIRPNEEGDRMESEEGEDNHATNVIGNDHVQHNSDVSLVIQQNQNNTNNAIQDEIVDESTANPTQSNLVPSNHHLQCPHCAKSFDHKSHLERHVRVHTGERPFACDQCGKAFRQKVHLTQHQLFHQNIKPFHCDQCDKQFVLNIQLDSHLRTHSGERPYQCRFCALSFIEAGSRKTHEQAKHHHVKPYRCKVCGHTSTRRSTIIKHIRIIHFGLPPTIKEQRERNIVDDRDPKEFVEKVSVL